MTAELLSFTCPRCQTEAEDAFYGPCASCRDELVATMRAERRDVHVAEYEPKMNVVPNQVAIKE